MYEKSFTNNRPTDEDKIDSWFDELVGIWDALFEAISELNKDPSFMRTNNADEDEAAEAGHENNALFRPIIQEGVVAEVARMLLNRANTNTHAGMVNALKNLALIDWNMFHAPWRHLVIIKNDQDNWIMASEERVKRVSCAQETILWLVGHLQWEEDELEEHKSTYMSYLKCSEDEQKELWDSLLKLHKKING